jgi:hypothetical protein
MMGKVMKTRRIAKVEVNIISGGPGSNVGLAGSPIL